jgi:hypothetical protein
METNDTEKLQESEQKKVFSSWDLVIGLILGLFSVFVIAKSLMMPTYNAAVYVRPGIVPFIVGVALLGMSITLIVKSIRENGISMLRAKAAELMENRDAYRFLVLSIATLVYIALLDMTNLHFIILTLVFLWVVYIYLKVSILMSTILSIVSSVAIYLFFTQVFNVPMP